MVFDGSGWFLSGFDSVCWVPGLLNPKPGGASISRNAKLQRCDLDGSHLAPYRDGFGAFLFFLLVLLKDV